MYALKSKVVLLYIESVYQRDNLIKRANGNLSHKTPRSQTGSLRVEGSERGGSYN
jgi:hypothetical protein